VTERRSIVALSGGGALLAAACIAGLLIGPYPVSAAAIGQSFASHLPFLGVHSPLDVTQNAIVYDLRLPRIVLGLIVGGTLSLAGAAYQGVFRNPLADPYLLGVAAGAGLGATLAIGYGSATAASSLLLPAAAFAGAAISVGITYAIGRAGGTGAASLILAGVTVAAFLTALQTFFQQQRTQTIRDVYTWLLGQLETAGWRDVLIVLPYALIAWAVILAHRRLIDVLRVGDEETAALGVNVDRLRLIIVIAATVGTAAAVAVSGLIGFVGIIVPHAIRLVFGPSYRLLLPLSILAGGGFLVFADLLARTILSPSELPIGVVTAFFGAPFFALVMRTSRSFR
jgi:iron complex transport system permease protein